MTGKLGHLQGLLLLGVKIKSFFITKRAFLAAWRVSKQCNIKIHLWVISLWNWSFLYSVNAIFLQLVVGVSRIGIYFRVYISSVEKHSIKLKEKELAYMTVPWPYVQNSVSAQATTESTSECACSWTSLQIFLFFNPKGSLEVTEPPPPRQGRAGWRQFPFLSAPRKPQQSELGPV